jgi:putative thiamine transport system permease protein
LGGRQISLDPFDAVFATPGISRSIWLSLSVGLLTTAISLTLVMLFFAAWSGTRLFTRIEHLLSPMLSIPHAAAAFGLAFLIAPSGWLMRLISPELTGFERPPDWLILNDSNGLAMIAGLVIKEIPFLFLVTLAAMPQAKPGQYLRVASGLGYGVTAGFIFSIWPVLYRQIRLAIFAVIAYASSVVDVALILGPTSPPPLAVRLVQWMNDPDLTMRFNASAGALLQLGTTALALVLWIIGERLAACLVSRYRRKGRRFASDWPLRLLGAGLMVMVAVVSFVGLGVLALWSLAGYWAFPDALPQSLTLDVWEKQIGAIFRPLNITWVLGLAVTLVAVSITLACLERESHAPSRGTDRALLALYLPLIVPQPAFVFGLQMFFLVTGMNGTFGALVLVHLVFVLPYVFLSLSDPWRSLDRRYALTAGSLGAGTARIFWRVKLPMLSRAVLTAAAIGFAVSIGQYLPTLMIGAGRWPTLTTEAVALASGGDRRVIGVYAFLQMALPFLGFLVATLVPLLLFANRKGLQVK